MGNLPVISGAEWLRDPAIRTCSVEARGLLMDVLSLIAQGGRRGYLTHATGKPITTEQIARIAGLPPEQVSRLLMELANSGVLSPSDDGTIFSRRLVAAARKRELCAQAGRKGGGNPILGSTYKGPPKGGSKGQSKGRSKVGYKHPPPTNVGGGSDGTARFEERSARPPPETLPKPPDAPENSTREPIMTPELRKLLGATNAHNGQQKPTKPRNDSPPPPDGAGPGTAGVSASGAGNSAE